MESFDHGTRSAIGRSYVSSKRIIKASYKGEIYINDAPKSQWLLSRNSTAAVSYLFILLAIAQGSPRGSPNNTSTSAPRGCQQWLLRIGWQ